MESQGWRNQQGPLFTSTPANMVPLSDRPTTIAKEILNDMLALQQVGQSSARPRTQVIASQYLRGQLIEMPDISSVDSLRAQPVFRPVMLTTVDGQEATPADGGRSAAVCPELAAAKAATGDDRGQ